MKKAIYLSIIAAAGLGICSCSDFLDKKSSAFDSDGFYMSDAGINDGVTGVYRLLIYDQNWAVPQCAMQDMYCPYGLEADENNTISAGGGLTPDQSYVNSYWAGHWAIVARANNVIDGAKLTFDELVDGSGDASAVYRRRLAEAYAVRDYAYYNLVQAYGDIPFFTSSVTTEQYNEPRHDKKEIADYIIAELTAIGEANILPWDAENRGRAGNGMVYNLIARWALLAGSHDFGGQGTSYFEKAAEAAKQVMEHHKLAANFGDLFTLAGQAQPDVQNEILWQYNYTSSSSVIHTHRLRYGHTSRTAGGSSVRFPSTLLQVCFEDKYGKRIDESDVYDPKKPYLNRDPRMHHTMLMHGDTMWFNNRERAIVLNCYDNNSRQFPNPRNKNAWYAYTNVDVTGTSYSFARSGVGALWNKYNEDVTESFSESTIDIIVMRAAEAYLTYAEAMIELNRLDETVYEAINKVRRRAGMPEFGAERKGNQALMRQIVRRERKVELAQEGVLVTDFRRWHLGDILNAQPTYGQPKGVKDAKEGEYNKGYDGLTKADMPKFYKEGKGDRWDLNDVPNFEDVADKYTVRDRNRFWAERFLWWPIPRVDLDRNKNLTNPEGY
ncbi:MAG: RagB/SusD family nutrient uptake outer membrane protein [Muribaculaceae bacterium]|nr:RagB/SusD family nutrient uptake outer membrane protein [Muribaculaceae bacterium]